LYIKLGWVQKGTPTLGRCGFLSQETVKNALENFGLTEKEAEVYIFLAKRGALRTGQIAKQLKKNKGQVYRILSNLKKKGVVEATLEFPTRYSAVSLEKTINSFLKSRREEISLVEKTKEDLLRDWERISRTEVELAAEKFTVIEGTQKIFRKMAEMVEKTQNSLSATSTVKDLVRAEQFGVFDSAYTHTMRYTIKFRFLTELSKHNLKAITLLKPKLKSGINVKARNPELGLASFPRMVIRDDDEILFFISPKKDLPPRSQEVCIHTNCGSLIQAFTGVFEELWRHSTDIENKIVEIETGKPTPKTTVITDAEMAEEKYNRMLRTAEKEIVLMTSANDLNLLSERILPPKRLVKRKASVRIMAPITNENLKSAKQLSEYYAVKHVPVNYWRTLIVDERHLLQFRPPPADMERPESAMPFETAYYSKDSGYVKRMKCRLEDIWKNAQAPSATKLKSTIGPYGPARVPLGRRSFLKKGLAALVDFKPPGTITKEDILNKIINARKIPTKDSSKHISRLYGSQAMAEIHPPDYFNLPDMRIQVTHAEKQSTAGGGDYLIVFLWQETPKGHIYVPVAIMAEESIETSVFKIWFAGTPAAQNIQRAKTDEIQVQVHGNTLFAGWTVPIQLYPPQYILPPSCLLVEGYGDVHPGGITIVPPSGIRTEMEGNYLPAFFTFIHPESNYSGPGFHVSFAKDLVMTAYLHERTSNLGAQSSKRNQE
jgi:sugar-specific transcriptional regulator TrmB